MKTERPARATEHDRRDLFSDVAGVSALEYGVVASLLALVLASLFRNVGTVMTDFGSAMSALFAGGGGSV